MALDGDEIVDQTILAGGIIEKRERDAVVVEIFFSGKVDDQFLIDEPCQLVVGQSRIDANGEGVFKRSDADFIFILGIHATKIRYLAVGSTFFLQQIVLLS